MSEDFIIPAIVATIIFLLVMFSAIMFDRRSSLQGKVKRLAAYDTKGKTGDDHIVDALSSEEKTSSIANLMAILLSLMGAKVEKFRKESQMRFYRAGISSPSASIYFMFFKRFGIFIFLLLAYAMATLPGTGMLRMAHYLVAFLFVISGLFGADLFLNNAESKRKKTLTRSFPDALDLLLVCVESGLALDGALARVCKELGRAYPAIAGELNRTRLELTLLNDRSKALTNLADRTDLLAFRALTTTLLQSEKFGTSLTDTLRVLSEDYRNTRLMLAEEKAGRLPVLMTVPLILLMMPALFLIILGPTIIRAMALPPSNM